ncbi:PREDICTED: glutamyl-tRNA(Gln) amidotransferase subunit A, mitochondrial [Dufourea novaeangliae]|uniref:Glutamyl-tRNA(Gln) amidotransferase subunit A, mitochondrial n=1 Tax=Dufourea novaeangliae TaxID=178035 RepID=A0A154P122_DUFNO|nr:PREDICTED: glutamyl-tRNA(Gln) amidotransferase subunit A, mitochondrial [Dufourea novaeangliae]KZC05626.1 Glutamyl-tRNA(Gln) amidotransferase subunit A, mitochondrial [Dufourea novaeangliae]
MNKLLSTSIKEVSHKINAGDVRPSDITKAAVKLTTFIKPLNAYITVTDETAKKEAENSNSRQENHALLGKLDGIPIAVKDNYCTNDHLTTCASKMLSNFVPPYNATVYQRLKDAGAILIGKTNLDEFGMGSGTIDSYYGPTKNLWNSDILTKCYSNKISMEKHTEQNNDENSWHITGGSSGGSAVAVATGSCFAALGSDTGGSTRNPASYCGVIGLKPTYGLVSRYGLIPLVNSMDVPGILARNVDDVLLILNTIAGPDRADSTSSQKEYVPFNVSDSINISNVRIGIPKEYKVKNISSDVQECWDEVSLYLKEAGASISMVSMPHTSYSIACYSVLNRCDVASNLSCYDGMEYGLRADEWKSVHDLYRKTRTEGFGQVVKERILVGNYFLLEENYDEYYVKAMRMRRLISNDFDVVWNNNIDLLLTPTTLTEAPSYNEFVSLDNQTQCLVQDYCTQPANMAGIPAINVPIKLSKNGLPLSLQLMAPSFNEERLLTVAKWIEQRVKFPKLELKDMSLLE